MPDALIHTRGLHHTSILGYVSEEDGHASVLGVGMFDVSDASLLAVGVECCVCVALGTQLVAELSSGSTCVDTDSFGIHILSGDAVFLYVFGQCGSVYALDRGIQQTAFGQFSK